MLAAFSENGRAPRNFGLVASRLTNLMIHVAEANGVPSQTMRAQSGLISNAADLLRDDRTVPWKDFAELGERIFNHFGDLNALVALGRDYYKHLEFWPYTRFVSSILTVRGAFFISTRYITPHNYEALDCSIKWLNKREGINTARLKYPDDPHSAALAHMTQGMLEYFPTIFGRDPMERVEIEMGERHARYHLTLPPPPRAWVSFTRAVRSILPGQRRWQMLGEQEKRLMNNQWDAARRQRIMDELLAGAPEPLALLEGGTPVFINQATAGLLGSAAEAKALPFKEIALRMADTRGEARVKFAYQSLAGETMPLEAILSARLAPDGSGKDTLLIRLRDRREPETREEAMTLAREQERQTLARDLHDGLGQTLSGISYRIAALRHANPGDAALAAVDSGIRSALTQARHIAHKGCDLTDAKLVERLRLTCAAYTALADLPVDFSIEGDEQALATIDSHETDLILREALANAVRHSGASVVTVSLRITPDEACLEISDNGRGLPADYQPGFGVASMKRRAELLCAVLEWLPAPAQGTLVRCRIPATRS